MAERVISDPTDHGWVDAGGGKWKWAGAGTDAGPAAWDEIIDKPDEFPPSAHNHDGVYQPVGDYIEGDAPSDGELYVRKDGAWELYTPSSGGGGNLIDPIVQPVVVGDFSVSSGTGYWKTATYRPHDNAGTTVNFPIPNGYKFILLNIYVHSMVLWSKEIKLDGVSPYGSFDDSVSTSGGNYVYQGDGQIGKPNFLVSNNIELHTRSSFTNGHIKIYGMFIPADSTFESAEIRDAYIAANAEAWAALPPPEPDPEVGTQEISE